MSATSASAIASPDAPPHVAPPHVAPPRANKLRVLLVAEAANPEWASVPLVGWSHCQALSKVVDGHVVTHARNLEAINRTGWREGVEFTAIDSDAVARPIYQLGQLVRRTTGLGWTASTAMASASYYYFEHLLWKRFGKRIRDHEFDLVHRVTPLSPTTPSVLAYACARAGVPFVLGPLNGGVPWPKSFGDVQAREGEWLSYVRDAYKLLPGYRTTRQHATAIIVGSEATCEQMGSYRAKCVYVPENAIDPARFDAPTNREPSSPLRVAFVGRLVPYKGADMLIEACAPLIREGKVVVDVIGDGPERPRLERLIAESGLEGRVELSGWLQHVDVQRRLSRSDVFGFPSIREFGGGAVLEAMALGLAPVVADYAGPREIVTAATGYRVAMGTRADLIRGFREVMTHLASHPQEVRALGERARKRAVSLFTWTSKAEQTLEVYQWALGRAPKPDFGMPFPDSVS